MFSQHAFAAPQAPYFPFPQQFQPNFQQYPNQPPTISTSNLIPIHSLASSSRLANISVPSSPAIHSISSRSSSSSNNLETDLETYGRIDDFMAGLHNQNPQRKLDVFISVINDADYYGVHELASLTHEFLVSHMRMTPGNATFLLDAAKKLVAKVDKRVLKEKKRRKDGYKQEQMRSQR